MTHNTTGQAVSLYGVEYLQFDDGIVNLQITGSGIFKIVDNVGFQPSIAGLSNGGFVVTWNHGGDINVLIYDANDNAPGTITLNANPILSTAIAVASTNEDSAYSYNASINFNDVDDTLTYSATLSNGSAVPNWLSINSTTGVLSVIPANGDVGAIDVTVTATDSAGSSMSDTYTLSVNNTNNAPVTSATTIAESATV
jgi:hypothetical protein